MTGKAKETISVQLPPPASSTRCDNLRRWSLSSLTEVLHVLEGSFGDAYHAAEHGALKSIMLSPLGRREIHRFKAPPLQNGKNDGIGQPNTSSKGNTSLPLLRLDAVGGEPCSPGLNRGLCRVCQPNG